MTGEFGDTVLLAQRHGSEGDFDPVADGAALPGTRALDPMGTVLIPPGERPARQGAAPAGQPQPTRPAPPLSHAPELSADRLLRRRPAAGRGLRLVGARGAERRQKQEAIRTPVRDCYRIVVLGSKGGVGRTAITLALGSVFAVERSDRVLAVDASPNPGAFGCRVRPRTARTLRDLVTSLPEISGYLDVRQFTARTPTGLEVLAGDLNSQAAADYRKAMAVLTRQYPLIVTDTGTELQQIAAAGILDLADQIVIAATPSADGAANASLTLDWLAAHGYHDLARRSITVISTIRKAGRLIRTDDLVAHFATRCRAVLVVPFDEHLAAGAELEPHRLRPRTRKAYLDLAALVAQGMPEAQLAAG